METNISKKLKEWIIPKTSQFMFPIKIYNDKKWREYAKMWE